MSVVEEAPAGESAGADAMQAPEATVLFMSRRSALRLTRKPRVPLINPVTGQRSGMSEGQSIGFRDGVLRIPKEGEVRSQDTLDAGTWKCDAAELLEWLNEHRLNGDIEEGFWQVDQTAPPISRGEMDAMLQAAMSLDVDGLRAMAERERAGWEREDVIETIVGLVDKIELEKTKAVEAHLAAQAAETAPEVEKTPEAAQETTQAPIAGPESGNAAGLGENATGDPAPVAESSVKE